MDFVIGISGTDLELKSASSKLICKQMCGQTYYMYIYEQFCYAILYRIILGTSIWQSSKAPMKLMPKFR